jgi:hypothetical protein
MVKGGRTAHVQVLEEDKSRWCDQVTAATGRMLAWARTSCNPN